MVARSSPAGVESVHERLARQRLADERDQRVVLARAHDHDRRVVRRRPRRRRCRRRPGPGPAPGRPRFGTRPSVSRARAQRARSTRRGTSPVSTPLPASTCDVVPRRSRRRATSGRIIATLDPTNRSREHDPERAAPERLPQLAPGDQLRGVQPGHAASGPRRLRGRAPRGSAPRPRSRRGARGDGSRRAPPRDRRAVRAGSGCRWRRPNRSTRRPSIHDGSTAASTRSHRFGLSAFSVRRSPCKHDATVVEQRDRLAEVLDEVELMAREEEVATGARVLGDHVREEAHRDRIEPGERLVEHEEIGTVHHRRRQLHALRHAAGERRDLVARSRSARSSCSRSRRARRAPVDAVEAVEPRDPDQEIEHAHVAVQAAFLRHVAPPPPVGVGHRAVPPFEASRRRARARRTGCASAWSCRPRWARAGRRPCPPARPDPPRRGTMRAPNRWGRHAATSVESRASSPWSGEYARTTGNIDPARAIRGVRLLTSLVRRGVEQSGSSSGS